MNTLGWTATPTCGSYHFIRIIYILFCLHSYFIRRILFMTVMYVDTNLVYKILQICNLCEITNINLAR